MDLAEHWLDAQKATPSFVTNFQQIDDILNAPLPTALQQGHSTPMGVSKSRVRSVSPRVGMEATFSRKLPIHEELLEKGRLYEQRKEALKERALKEEEKNLRKGKKLSAEEAKQIQKTMDQRFARLAKEKEDSHKYLVMKLDKEERQREERWGFSPKISVKGRRAKAKLSMLDQQSNWQRRKDEDLERLRHERIVKEMAEIQDAPDITLRSQKLAMKRREKEGLAGLSHIDAMLERDRLGKLAQWERYQQEQMKVVSNPKITAFAASINYPEDVSTRLYQQSFEAEERKAQRIREKLSEQHQYFSPRITAVASSVQRQRPVEDELMLRHLESLALKDDVARRQAEREREFHTPALNPVSDAIAARLPMSSKERLYQPKSQFRDPNDFQGASRSSSNVSETQRVSKLEASHLERLVNDEGKRKERMEQLRLEKERKELQECTFRPQTTTQTTAHARPDDVYARISQWQKKKEGRIQEVRAQKDHHEVAQCTFQPETRRVNDAKQTIDAYQGQQPWGVDDHVSRQAEARRRQEERMARQVTPTQNWRNEPTIPDEFNFGRRIATPIRALERPVAPLTPSTAASTLNHQLQISSPAHFSKQH